MKKNAWHNFSIGVVLSLAMFASPAVAHTSDAVGFWHLVSGVDHVLVLVAIGLVFGFLLRSVNR